MSGSAETKPLVETPQEDTPVSRAVKRRKELQDIIKNSMKELEKLEDFLRMYRQFSTDGTVDNSGVDSAGRQHYILGRVGVGQTQPMFEQLTRAALLEAGRPMRSPEIIEAFRERGHPIGGNETRAAWNRLWDAKKRGVLINIKGWGYWLADEPIPSIVKTGKPPKRTMTGRASVDRGKGRPVGRARTLTPAQIETLEGWFAEGKKTRKQMGLDMGGLSVGSINNYRQRWLIKNGLATPNKSPGPKFSKTGKRMGRPPSPNRLRRNGDV